MKQILKGGSISSQVNKADRIRPQWQETFLTKQNYSQPVHHNSIGLFPGI